MFNKTIIILFSIINLILFIDYCYIQSNQQTYDQYDFAIGSWEKYSDNPVLKVGASGSWDDYWVAPTSFVKVGSTYYMYYNGMQSVAGSCQVGLATSTDGIIWTKHASNPVLHAGTLGEFDYSNTGSAVVWLESHTFYMIYNTMNETTSVWYLGLATSPDGINWTKYAGNPIYTGTGWNSAFLQSGSILKEDNTYYLYFAGNNVPIINEDMSIGVLISTNLHTWTPYIGNPILSGSGLESWDAAVLSPCSVIKSNNIYYMWYEGVPFIGGTFNRSEIGLASSSLPFNGWVKDNRNPVLRYANKEGIWDRWWTEAGVILNFNDTECRMYYTGTNAMEYVECGMSYFVNNKNEESK